MKSTLSNAGSRKSTNQKEQKSVTSFKKPQQHQKGVKKVKKHHACDTVAKFSKHRKSQRENFQGGNSFVTFMASFLKNEIYRSV